MASMPTGNVRSTQVIPRFYYGSHVSAGIRLMARPYIYPLCGAGYRPFFPASLAFFSRDEEEEAGQAYYRSLCLPLAFSIDLLGIISWYIQSTCATSGEGLYEGLDWLSSNIATKG
ncbi:hypothetical protein M5K25_003177 [Dendrobium thyrsiflorum]|uniref:Uncharacterized protein n=1 Tax=Dendrobium thyrsiflorum TaxID=117978 RepID=A0ABD0VVY8_DENTH